MPHMVHLYYFLGSLISNQIFDLFPFLGFIISFLYSLLCHVDYRFWRGVAGCGEVVAVSLHADGLQPVLNSAHSRGRLWAAWLQQRGVGPVVGGQERNEASFLTLGLQNMGLLSHLVCVYSCSFLFQVINQNGYQ